MNDDFWIVDLVDEVIAVISSADFKIWKATYAGIG